MVSEGDILLEIMSDKTNMELEAEDSGVLIKIVHGNGDVVPVTEVIGYLGAEGEVVAETTTTQAPAQPIPQEQVKPAPANEPAKEVASKRVAGEKFVPRQLLVPQLASSDLTLRSSQAVVPRGAFTRTTWRTSRAHSLRSAL